MKNYTVLFEIIGGVVIEAESADEAKEKFYNESCQEAVAMLVSNNEPVITEVFESDELEDL